MGLNADCDGSATSGHLVFQAQCNDPILHSFDSCYQPMIRGWREPELEGPVRGLIEHCDYVCEPGDADTPREEKCVEDTENNLWERWHCENETITLPGSSVQAQCPHWVRTNNCPNGYTCEMDGDDAECCTNPRVRSGLL